MKTCEGCGQSGGKIIIKSGHGLWHVPCWVEYRKTHLPIGKQFRVSRVAHGYIVKRVDTDEKISFHTKKQAAVNRKRTEIALAKQGWTGP